jgi:hypothetical protein
MSDAAINTHTFYVPWGDGRVDQHVALGAAWLRRQPGTPAVFVPAKQNFERNGTLPRLLPGVALLTERAQARSTWKGKGALLVCWPTAKMLTMLGDYPISSATAVCVLEWGEDPAVRAWLAAHEAIDVGTGARIAQQVQLPPVVLAAMRHLNQMVNHANGLAGSFDKALAIQTMTQLVRHGYRYELDDLCAWATTNGFTGHEVERLRDIAGKALNGHRFRSQDAALRPDIVKVWEAEANGDAQK